MIIESLKLNNFRNFKTLNIHFTKGINFLYGKNGSGKTNVVEAIYFFYLTKSFRTNNYLQLIKINNEF